jgi:hypothetical protein
MLILSIFRDRGLILSRGKRVYFLYIVQSGSLSQSYLTTDGQSASLSWCQATIRARDRFFFLLGILFRQLRVCYFVAPSLTRGRVCNILLLQGLASAVLLWPERRQKGNPVPGGITGTITRWYVIVPVIPPGTGFPFCRLLRLAGLRWRYSNAPPHGFKVALPPPPRVL